MLKMNHQPMILMMMIVALLGCAVASTLQWTPCSTTVTYPYTLSTVSMSPDPAVKGGNVSVTFSGTTHEKLQGGSWWLAVYYGIFKVQNLTGSVCDVVQGCSGCECPAGSVDGTLILAVPSYAPSGTYSGTFQATNSTGDLITCMKISYQTVAPGEKIEYHMNMN